MKIFIYMWIVFALLTVAGCGQRGPLYLPDEKGETVQKSAPPAQPQDDDEEKRKP